MLTTISKEKDYLLLGTVSFSLLVFEFLLSKELIFLHGMPLSFWVIPLIMLGFSLGSAAARVKFINKVSQEKLIFIYIASILFSLYSMIKIGVIFSPFSTTIDFFNAILKLLVTLIWPFIIIGLYFGRAYSGLPNLGKVFFSNGIGLMLGALSAGKVFRFFGWPGGIFFIVIFLLAFLVFIDRKRAVLYVLAIIAAMFMHKSGYLKTDWTPKFDIFCSPKENAKKIITRYNDLVRTDVVVSINEEYRIFNDGGAPTPIVRVSQPLGYRRVPRKNLPVPFSLADYDRVLIIGSGGGSDIYDSLRAGSRYIQAVELSPVTISLMQNEFSAYSGGIYLHPYVEVINREGRDYVRQTKERFDLIILRGVDTGTTFSFLSPFTFESYLYTKEALRRYSNILSEKGCITIMRDYPALGSGETAAALEILRLYKAVESLGLKEHAIITQKKEAWRGRNFIGYNILLFKNKVDKGVLSWFNSTDELVYFPGSVYTIDEIGAGYKQAFNVNYLSDDRPALYNFHKLGKILPKVLRMLLIICLPVIILSFLSKTSSRKTLFYLLLGIGYIALELNLMGKMVLFLGNPVYSMQVVLASFLLFGGLGGWWGLRHKIDVHRYLLILFSLSILLIFTIKLLYNLTIASQYLKNAIVFLFMAPIGFLSVIPFSQALSAEKKKYIMYALDGIGTILGTVLIAVIQIYGGFTAGFIFIALVYFSAILVNRRLA